MRRSRLPIAVLLGSAALCAGQALHYAAILPAFVASHFGPNGAPNAWMPRESFILLNLGVVGLLTVLFLGLSILMGSLHAESINLPDKKYWMAPERRQETVDFLAGYFPWFGSATLLLMLDMFRQVFRFNLGFSKTLDHPLASLGVYLFAVLAWMAGFLRRFTRK